MKKFILAICLLAGMAAAAQRRNNPALDSLRNEKDPAALKQKLDKLATGDEKDLNLLVSYHFMSGHDAIADSVRQQVIKRYPNGSMAFIQFQNTLYATRGGKAQEAFFLENKHKFTGENFDMQYYSIANAYAGDKDLKKMKEYTAMIKDTAFRSAAVRLNTRTVMGYDLKAAQAMARAEVEALYKKGIPPAPSADGARGMDERRAHYLEFMDLYATILIKSGKYDEALKYAKEAYDKSVKKSDQHTANYALLLSKTGKHKEAVPLLADIVGSGKGSADMKQALRESYIKLNPGKDAAAYLGRIEEGMKRKIEEEISKMWLNENAPAFAVKDINGKTVSLADFAGKTIVLDFWATWCGPCKKSFPAMQMAVNKYKHDPNVKFLFIHTWEKVDDPLTDASTYLKDNGYSFDLYMDTKNVKTKTNEAVTAFGVKGIPAKFIIDGNGKTRFKMMGFSGGDDAAVAELSAMIEMAKKQS